MVDQEPTAEQIFLTKELLLKGKRHIENVETSMGVFQVRPLTDGEKARIEALAVKGIKAHGRRDNMQNLDIDLDMEALISNDWEVRFHVLALGLSVDDKNRFSLPEVKSLSLPPEVSAQLIATIRRISGLPTAEVVLDRFRKKPSGAGTDSVDPAGVPT